MFPNLISQQITIGNSTPESTPAHVETYGTLQKTL